MRCIPARVGLALFLPCADLLSCEVLAQGTEARQGSEENVRHWHQSAEFNQLWHRQRLAKEPEERIALIEQALKAERDIERWPVIRSPRDKMRAELWWRLGVAYDERKGGDKAENLEQAIAAYEQALQYYTREKSPADWASLQTNVGLARLNRLRGERNDNLEKAIAHLEAALQAREREAMPQHWGGLHNELGRAYQNRIDGERADNIEKAIAHFELALAVPLEPRERALVQFNVAGAYLSRIRGDFSRNEEKAIDACQAAVSFLTRDTSPTHWAEIQATLARIFFSRRLGDQADNVEKAVGHYEAALSVYTRADWPAKWANMKFALGRAYAQRKYGVHADNVENAIDALEASLSYYTREAYPNDWASIQTILAASYVGRLRGDPAENIEKGIAGHEAALAVFGESPGIQNNLGVAYRRRIRGNPADNLDKAIGTLEAAVAVAGRAPAYAEILTASQRNLGRAYLVRFRGERADNLKRAIAYLDASLERAGAHTLRSDEHVFARELGEALVEIGEWDKASKAYARAREDFLLLFGAGLNEAQTRSVLTGAHNLFAEAAFVAAQQGDTAAALSLANEGRARSIAVALRLRTHAYPTDKGRRGEKLRNTIRAEQRSLETAQGTERAATVERLVDLRKQLLQWVEEATGTSGNPITPLDQARAVAKTDGAVVVPIITKFGSKIIIVGGASSPRAAARPSSGSAQSPQPNASALSVLDLPDLTADGLEALVRGNASAKAGGWLGAYNINYLQGAELDQRWPEWLAAVSNLAPELWRLFGAKLDAALKDRGLGQGARLLWLPSGALGILPLGLTQDPVTLRRFADTYQIAYAPSLETLAFAQKQTAARVSATLPAVVNPTGDLPGTEKEGKLVASRFATHTILVRSKATPDAVLSALKGKSYWHFASHGTFSWDDARSSALLMYDNSRLSVGRLLDTEGLGRPRLVVLSACETGLYDIDRNANEFVGLPGTFTALGAAGVLGTLWPVSDAATALLIAKFYELHMGTGLSPPAALSRAQTWLRQATNLDLQAYARTAAKRARLDSRHIAEIEQELSVEGLARSRNRVVFEAIEPDGKTTKGKASSSSRLVRPYAHPYFWAGFIHTGL